MKLNIRQIFSIITIPMSMNQWIPTPLKSYDLPKVINNNQVWKVSTKNSAGGSSLTMPKKFKRILDSKNYSVSHIIFYSPIQFSENARLEGKSPYFNQVAYRLMAPSPKVGDMAVDPFKDAQRLLGVSQTELEDLKVIGIWVFADSDNTHSTSVANLAKLRVSVAP